MAGAPDLPSGKTGHGTQWAIVGVLVGLFVILLVAGYFFNQVLRLEEAQSLAESEAIARGVAAFIQAREENYVNSLLAYAGRFRFREAVERKNRAEALVHLRQFRDLFSEMDSTFLADPGGVLWARFPETPGLYGRSFADRDWHRGVSREWRPYVSEVFVSAGSGVPVVALAVPIRDLKGKVIGIIGSSQRLDVIRQWLLPIKVPGGDLYLVDRKGQFVFHPTRTGPGHLSDYARVPIVGRLLRGEEGVLEQENPVEHDVRLAAYRPLPSLGWGLVVQRNKNLALQRMHTLILGSGTVGLVLTIALTFLGVVAIRSQRRVVVALDERNRSTEELRRANDRYRERLRILREIDQAILAEEAPVAIGEAAVRGLRDLLGVPRAIVNLFDLASGEAEWLAAAGRRRVHLGPGVRFPLTLMGDVEALRRGEPQVIDVTSLPRGPEAEALLASGVHAYMAVPMIAGGELIGALSFGGAHAEFPPEHISITREVADQMAIALSQARLYERVKREAEELEQRVRERTAQLEAAQDELVRAERLAILGQLAGGMSHELRNPLGVIKNSVYYLRMVLPEEERVRKHLGILDREVETATRIISGLLDFARVTPPSRVEVDLNALVRDQLERMPQPDSITVVLELASDLPPVLADPEQIRLVLSNLISNANQAMPNGGTLTIQTVHAAAGVTLTVADTGLGIAPEHLERIFEPLFTTEAKGIGLGLPLAKRLVESNQGKIRVESTPGQGTCFELRFAGV